MNVKQESTLSATGNKTNNQACNTTQWISIQKRKCILPPDGACIIRWIQAWRRNLDSTMYMHHYILNELHDLSTGWHFEKSLFKADITLRHFPICGHKTSTLKGSCTTPYKTELELLCALYWYLHSTLICTMLVSAVRNLTFQPQTNPPHLPMGFPLLFLHMKMSNTFGLHISP